MSCTQYEQTLHGDVKPAQPQGGSLYSIDECFLDLSGIRRDLVAYGIKIKETVVNSDLKLIQFFINLLVTTVTRWTGLPICLG
jgi:DNA polymerase V